MSRLNRMVEETLLEAVDTKTITRHYMAAVEWTEEDELDGASWSKEALRQAAKDVRAFVSKAKKQLALAAKETTLSSSKFWAQVGHDFWLTRNGHGAGFWDDPDYYGGQDNADALSDIAGKFGEVYAYVGDDGKAYF